MKTIERLLQQRRMAQFVAEAERLAEKLDCPLSDLAYYLIYQTEVSSGCAMQAETARDYPDERYSGTMSEAIENSRDASHDVKHHFIDDYHDEILATGKRWDPEFRRRLENRTDYAKHTNHIQGDE